MGIAAVREQGAFTITRRVSEGFTKTLVKRSSAINLLRFELGWRQIREFKTDIIEHRVNEA